jgi:recombination protein RecT
MTQTEQPTASTEHVKQAIQAQQEQPEQKQLSPYRKVEQTLEQLKPQILRALPNTGITPEQLARITLTTVKMNPLLLNCDSESLFGAVMQAAQLGLQPNLLGSCYFIPYKDNKNNRMVVQFQIGYRGLIDLVMRSGQVRSIMANVAYENDFFEYEYGLNEKLRHIPTTEERGEAKHVYAYVMFKEGGHSFVVMPISEVYKIRDNFSKSFQGAKKYNNTGSSIWVKHFDSMARKTAIKQLIKFLPLSTNLQEQVSYDETVRDNFEEEPRQVFDMEGEEILEEMETAAE